MASNIVGYERLPANITVSRGQTAMQIRESYEFLVYSDDRSATRQEIMFGTPGIPIVGVLYSENGLICESVSANRKEEDPQYWIVTCEFTSGTENMTIDASVGPPGLPSSPGGQNDPSTWIPIFQINRFESITRVESYDFSGGPGINPISGLRTFLARQTYLNCAGIKFDTPLTRTHKCPVMTWTQFEPGVTSLKAICDRSGTTNHNAVTVVKPVNATFASRTLLLSVTKAELGYWYGFLCWRVEYETIYNQFTWDLEILEVSPQYLDANGKLQPYYDDKNTTRIYGNIIGQYDGATGSSNLSADYGKKKTKVVGGQTVMDPIPDFSKFVPYPTIVFQTFVKGIQ